ncbi:copper-containing nitrite reductase [Nisaea nitritireducens]|uniref:hypothetical protein n=1 Tax=Nisaea nitritireducens TaxID=568392 RepID=UPI001D027329
MNGLIPSHVVFNGKVGALTGDNALKASQGERVLFVHSQANRDSRPHLIGGHGDLVWEHGKWNNDLMEQVVAPTEYNAAHEGKTDS